MLASFGSAVWLGGIVSLPNLLFSYYSRLGLNEIEVMLLVHLYRLECFEGEPFPTPERLSEFMTVDAGRVRELMASLMEKKILRVISEKEHSLGRNACRYCLQDLMLRIAQIWLEDQETSAPAKDNVQRLADTYVLFEKEFGRPLSPLENSQLTEWCRNYPAELIAEALRLSVLNGIYNFRYIDSILREWRRNNVRTLRETKEHEARFREKRNKRRTTKNSRDPGEKLKEDKPKEDKYKDLYLS